jgi:prepilin-type processing-associated H-X9-DG protein
MPPQRMRIIFAATFVIALILRWCGLAVRSQRAIADRQLCASQLISLGQAILLYCNENRGNLPQSWREIYMTQDPSPEVFVCPASDDVRATGDNIDARAQQLLAGGHCSYQYLGSGNLRNLTADIVLAIENRFHHGSDLGANVLFGDGQVRHMTGAASKHIYDAISRGERPVRYSGNEGLVMRKSG